MSSHMRVWFEFVKRSLAIRMAYRLDFLISLFAMFLFELISPLFAIIIYTNSRGFLGWSFYEIILMQGIVVFIKGFAYSNFGGIVWNANFLLRKGEFDLTLIRPRNVLFTFISQSFDSEDIAKYVGGLGIIVYALYHLDIHMINLLLMIVYMIFGVVLFLAIFLLSSAFIFRVIRTFKIYGIFDTLSMFASYPRSIYSKSVGGFFTFIIPFFIAGSIPAEIFFGKFTIDMFYAALATLLFLGLSLWFWFLTIKRYSSAGG